MYGDLIRYEMILEHKFVLVENLSNGLFHFWLKIVYCRLVSKFLYAFSIFVFIPSVSFFAVHIKWL